MAPRRITIGPGVVPANCPSCGRPIPWRYVSATRFFCPACRIGLRMSASYIRVLYLLSGGISGLLAYAAGIRSEPLFVVTFLAWWPTYFVILFITIPLFPPDLEPTGDYRGILYDSLVDEEAPSVVAARPSVPVESAGGMFHGVGQRRSVGDVIFAALGVLLLVFGMWIALRPVLYRIAPELGATYSGPSSFPVRLHIGRAALGVSNPSGTQWTCDIELGVWPIYSITAIVASQRSRELPYSAFVQTADDRGLSPDRAARERVDIRCSEPDGIVHFWIAD
jgi:predicted RNA-binding Zn-ribbon protein involved in translation (DUF1610 family)